METDKTGDGGHMASIREFLTTDFLTREGRSRKPDGRLLYLYHCEDREFWNLVELLSESGPPSGHDFDQYRAQWRTFREEPPIRPRPHRFHTYEPTDLDWVVRAFVLYAAEFWRRFRNDEWRQRSFPDKLPFRRLTWLQFLSLVNWTDLYHEDVAGYVTLRGTAYRVAHTSKRYAEDSSENPPHNGEDYPGGQRSVRPGIAKAGHYPGLYFPMLAAWDWWQVAPVRLPSSIRYLDTFALQGGAADRLVVECMQAYETDSEIVYRPVKPPTGYGITALPIEKKALPPDADVEELHVTLVFGSRNPSIEV